MKDIKISSGGSSGQWSFVFAIILSSTGFYYLSEGIERGRILAYFASAVQFLMAGYFALNWHRYFKGHYSMAYDSESYEIRVRGIIATTGSFHDLKNIAQDGRGYTITCYDNSQYRILRKDMNLEFQSTLNSNQEEAEQ